MSRSPASLLLGNLLLTSGAGGAEENMAIDQALLVRVDKTGVPALRVYSWQEPTLSLGYFQRYRDRQQHAASASSACVRRATGGGAILHHHELTYSIVMPIKSSSTQARLRLYRQMHDVFIGVLRQWGIRLQRYADAADRRGDRERRLHDKAFLCFQRRTDDDLVLSGYKVMGSAQRRTRNAVLQHGSLLLRASRHAPELPGIADLTSKSLASEEVAKRFVETTTELIGIKWRTDKGFRIDASELDPILRNRFGSSKWLLRR